MRGGDLSYDLAPGIGFRFERVVKTEEGKLNRAAKAYMEQVIGKTDSNIYIITTEDERKALLFLVKWKIPYSRLIKADSELEIAQICVENTLLTYYDYDLHVLNNVRSRGKERVQAEQWTKHEVW